MSINIFYQYYERVNKAKMIQVIQSYWSESPNSLREFEEDVEPGDDLGTNEKYLQAFLMKIQNDVFDRLFELVEDK